MALLSFLFSWLFLEDGFDESFYKVIFPLLLEIFFFGFFREVGPFDDFIHQISKRDFGFVDPKRLYLIMFFLFILDVGVQLIQDPLENLTEHLELVQSHIFCQQGNLFGFVQLYPHLFIQLHQIPPQKFKTKVSFDSALMKIRLLWGLLRDKVEQLTPNLVFKQHFGTLHLETGVDQV